MKATANVSVIASAACLAGLLLTAELAGGPFSSALVRALVHVTIFANGVAIGLAWANYAMSRSLTSDVQRKRQQSLLSLKEIRTQLRQQDREAD